MRTRGKTSIALAAGALLLSACSSGAEEQQLRWRRPVGGAAPARRPDHLRRRARTTPTSCGRSCREVERGAPEREGHVQGADRPGRPAARRPRSSTPGQGRRLRRDGRRRGLDRGVRRQGLAAAAQGQLALDTVGAAAGDRQGGHLQRQAVRRADDHRRRHALLPQGPGAQAPPATWDELLADCARSPRPERHRLLRRPVRQVRGPDRQRRRGHQQRRRRDRQGRRQDPERRHPRGRKGLDFLVDGLQGRATSRRRPSPSRRSRAARPSRPASCCSCATGRTSYNLARTDGAPRSRASSASRRCPASTVPAPPASVATTSRSARTPSTRRPRWTSSSS